MAHATDPARTRTPAAPSHRPVLDVLDETIAARRAGGHSTTTLVHARTSIAQLLSAAYAARLLEPIPTQGAWVDLQLTRSALRRFQDACARCNGGAA